MFWSNSSSSTSKKGLWSTLGSKAGNAAHGFGRMVVTVAKKGVATSGFILGGIMLKNSISKDINEDGLDTYDDGVGMVAKSIGLAGMGVASYKTWRYGFGTGLKSAFKTAALATVGYGGFQVIEGIADASSSADNRAVITDTDMLIQKRQEAMAGMILEENTEEEPQAGL